MYSSLALRLVCLVSHLQRHVSDMSDFQEHVAGNLLLALSCYRGKLMVNGGSSRILQEVIGVITTVCPSIGERRRLRW
jgi:hypothetical protein